MFLLFTEVDISDLGLDLGLCLFKSEIMILKYT